MMSFRSLTKPTKSVRGVELGLGTFSVLASVAVAFVVWSVARRENAAGPSPAERLKTFTVATVPIVEGVEATGEIRPGAKTVVLSPFDGYVRDTGVALGDRVQKGNPLIVMDTGELDVKTREAETALLKATMAADALTRWESGPDVMKARQTLATAGATLSNLEKQKADLKILFDRGIVSRNEFDGLKQQIEQQRAQVEMSRRDLDATLERGSAANRRLAELDVAGARSRMDDLVRQAAGTVVRAPIDGLVIRAPVSAAAGRADVVDLSPGTHLVRGQAIFTVASLDSLVVDGQFEELDVGRIHKGQKVEIQGDAFPGFPLSGVITSIAAEAEHPDGPGSPGKFSVRAEFRPPPDLAPSIKVGMTARLRIETYANPRALVIPQDAVMSQDGQAGVRRLDPSGVVRFQPVRLGVAAPTGIEVTDGISEGTTILLP